MAQLCFDQSLGIGGNGFPLHHHWHRPPINKPKHLLFSVLNFYSKPFFSNHVSLMTISQTQNDANNNGNVLCSISRGEQSSSALGETLTLIGSPGKYLSGESRVERAWAHWTKLGRPKYIVAPMVDHSELPFRLLCRKYGAEAAYTPMLHSRIFAESQKYRDEEFTTCKEDRPLFVQFCGNDPDVLLEAARIVEPYCDYVDINLG